MTRSAIGPVRHRSRRLAPLLVGACVAVASCKGDTPGPSHVLMEPSALPPQTLVRDRPGPDTATVESSLERFRSTLASHPVSLGGGSRSREALVGRIVAALAASDTSALGAFAVTRAEYAWLIYPESPLLHPPYRQPIDVAWMLHAAPHAKGFARLLHRLGGRQMRFESVGCSPEPVTQGSNRFWTRCTTRITIGPDAVEMRLFTALVERDGVFKVMSYDNDF